MPKDKAGNTLHDGDWVEVQIGNSALIGRVTKISEGGTILPGPTKEAQLLQAGKVSVTIVVDDNYDPRIGVATSMVKIHHPTEGKETVN